MTTDDPIKKARILSEKYKHMAEHDRPYWAYLEINKDEIWELADTIEKLLVLTDGVEAYKTTDWKRNGLYYEREIKRQCGDITWDVTQRYFFITFHLIKWIHGEIK